MSAPVPDVKAATQRAQQELSLNVVCNDISRIQKVLYACNGCLVFL